MNLVDRIRTLEYAIRDNKRVIATASSPRERDMARSRINILTRKVKELRGKLK